MSNSLVNKRDTKVVGVSRILGLGTGFHFSRASRFTANSSLAVLACFFLSCRESKDTNSEADSRAAKTRLRPVDRSHQKSERGALPDLSDKMEWMGEDGLPVKIDQDALIAFLRSEGSKTWDLDGPNGGYLRSFFYWCDESHLEEAMAILGKCSGNSTIKRLYLDGLVRKSFGDGNTGSLAKVQAAIERHFGKGLFASDGIQMLFETAGFSRESIDALRGLKADQKMSALSGLSLSLRYAETLDHIDRRSLSTLTREEGRILTAALGKRVAKAEALGKLPNELLREAIELVPDSTGLVELFRESATAAPKEVWELLSTSSFDLSAADLEAVRRSCISAMAAESGDRALELAMQMPHDGGRAELLGVGMLAYLRNNDVAASEWLDSHREKLTSADIDHIETAFSRDALGKEDFPTAWKRVREIEDPVLKRKAEGVVWSKELEIVERKSRENPKALIDSIVAGESQHEPYWIETAMKEWISQDDAAAARWYEQNRKGLSPKQNEAIALTYARLAVASGDLEGAQRWTEQVVTPEFKEKIIRQIEGARVKHD